MGPKSLSPAVLLALVLVWAVSLCHVSAKKGDYLRTPFERKLKGTRRGCSSYGHSCFGGYGKRSGIDFGASSGLPAEDTGIILLRQTPGSASARTPLWGRSLPGARERDHDEDLLFEQGHPLSGVGAAAVAVAPEGEEVSGDPFDNALALANRWPMRRWLRAYRKPADRGAM